MPSKTDGLSAAAVSVNTSSLPEKRNPKLRKNTFHTISGAPHFAEIDLATNRNQTNVAAVTELLARVEELLRSPSDNRETILSVGPLQLDLLTRTVKRDDRPIDLRPREFRLLEYMMRRKGQVLTRAILFEEVWNYKFTPQSNLVDVHIGKLRRKVDGPLEPPMIYNVRRQGFVLRSPD